MDLDLIVEDVEQMDLYCDVLVRYLLVESALGECDLHRRLGVALDSNDTDRMAEALREYEQLPQELKLRIMDGDPTLTATLERSRIEADDSEIPANHSASA